MQTKNITLELTPDEIFDITYVLDAELQKIVKEEIYPKITKHNYREEIEFYDLFHDLVGVLSYTLSISGKPPFDFKYYHTVEDYVEALIKQRDSVAKE